MSDKFRENKIYKFSFVFFYLLERIINIDKNKVCLKVNVIFSLCYIIVLVFIFFEN